MTVLNLFWWAGYVIAAVIIQGQLPGFDALAPGFLIALQERKKMQVFWLFVLFCLIQEGTGSLRFGASLLWYGGHIVFFLINSRFFVADNILSVTLLSAILAVYRGLVFWFMSVIQDYGVDYAALLEECVLQALLVPLLWLLADLLRPGMAKNGN